MNFENEGYNDYDNELFDYLNDGQQLDGINIDDDSFEDFDDTIMDLDFSEIEGKSFKKEFSKVNKTPSFLLRPILNASLHSVGI